MYKKILKKANLTPTQAEILDYLYQNKEAKASTIAKEIKKSRAIVYRDLDELIDFKIVERIDKPEQVSIFRANHPTHLEKMIEQKENQIKKDRELFKDYLPDLVSSFNLINNKPGVKFFEGKEGMEKILYDTIKSKTEIYTIVDTKHIRGDFQEMNDKYVQKRIKAGIKKKIIEPGKTPEEKPAGDKFTQTRYLNEKYFPFKTAIQIYDNKISYQTLEEDSAMGVLIEDKNIYRLNKMIFEFMWEKAEEN